METLSALEIGLLVVGIALAGGVAGVLAGLLGVGGGIVIVPVLFWVFGFLGFDPGVAMQVAVASSLATIVATASSSVRAHHARGAVDTGLVRRWGPWMALGALAGGALAGVVDGAVLMLVFGLVGVAVAVNLALPRTLVLATDLPQATGAQPVMAGGVGTVSAMMGIGGGTLGVPLLSAFSVPIHRAVGTAAAFGLIIALPAMAALIATGLGADGRPPLSVGYVNLIVVALILPLSVTMAPVGARIAHALDARRVKIAFAFFLGITALRMLWVALG
jgi:uncharacterized membrane protein YfcA